MPLAGVDLVTVCACPDSQFAANTFVTSCIVVATEYLTTITAHITGDDLLSRLSLDDGVVDFNGSFELAPFLLVTRPS